MGLLPPCMSVHHTCALCSMRPEESIRSLRTGVTDGCELPRERWEPNLGFLEEKPVLLTTKPSFQPWLEPFFFKKNFKLNSQSLLAGAPRLFGFLWDAVQRGAVFKHSLCKYRLDNVNFPLRFCDPFIPLNMSIPATHECGAVILNLDLSYI